MNIFKKSGKKVQTNINVEPTHLDYNKPSIYYKLYLLLILNFIFENTLLKSLKSSQVYQLAGLYRKIELDF